MIEDQETVKIIGDDYTMFVQVPSDIRVGQSITESVWRHVREGRNLVWLRPDGDRVVVLNPARVSWIEL